MFKKHNAVLRGFPKIDLDGCSGNVFVSTIAALTSGLRKLMWVSPLPRNRRVFRGIGDVFLPEALLAVNRHGVRGGTEPGSNKDCCRI